jgi:hypothetical protein
MLLNRTKTDNILAKGNREKLVDQILQTENKIEQREPHYKPEMNAGAP